MQNAFIRCLLAGSTLSLAIGCSSTTTSPDAGGPLYADASQTDAGFPADAQGDKDAAPAVDTGPATDAGAGDAGTPIRTVQTNGSHVVATKDGQYVLVSNRSAGNLTLFKLTAGANPMEVRRFQKNQPGPIVLGNDDDTAYAIVRDGHLVQEITGLHSGANASLGRTAVVGGEPTGIAMGKLGAALWVTNWADGTVSEIRVSDFTVVNTIDLNTSLAGTGFLGPNVQSRPGLAHPQAIVLTNDGTATGVETAYVTEFFSQARTDNGVPTDDSAFDVNRQGVVYRFNPHDRTVGTPITIAPVASTGFVDSNRASTGCFPNQLYAAAINRGKLYVTAVCASPRGPVGPIVTGTVTNVANFKTEVHSAIFQIDTTTNQEVPANGILLTSKFQAMYDAAHAPDDGANRRIPLIPNDLAFVPSSNIAYVSAYGSDAVFRVAYDDSGAFMQVGSNLARFINLSPMGRLPIGLAISADGATGFVLNEHSRNLQLIAFASQSATVQVASADTPSGAELDVNNGRRFFVTGTGRWSFKGQAWNSCEACHPGGRTDNVTWFFARGPRQSVSLAGTFDRAGTTQRIMNWTGIFDEVPDLEQNTRGNSGGLGALVHQTSMPTVAADRIDFDGTRPVPAGQIATRTPQGGLNGSTTSLLPGQTASSTVVSVLPDWNQINAYVKTIDAPAPSNLVQADVDAGKALFIANNCASCHGGGLWSSSRRFYTPNETNNHPTTGLLRTMTYTLPMSFPMGLNPPGDAGMSRMSPLRFPAGPTAGANDQILCVLRAVGTFPMTLDADRNGVAPTGVRVKETRADMATPAQGGTGFAPPSLIGVSGGAPFFHAGNARTLEEVFDNKFSAHHTAFSANFLSTGDRAQQVRQLTAFLLTITKASQALDPPNTLGYDTFLCPTSL